MQNNPLHPLAEPRCRQLLGYAYLALFGGYVFFLRFTQIETKTVSAIVLITFLLTLSLFLIRAPRAMLRTWQIRNRNHRIYTGHCLHCNYDLRASPSHCPECGHSRNTTYEPYLAPKPLFHSSLPLLITSATLLLLVVFPSYGHDRKATAQSTRASLANLQLALQAFQAEFGRFPTSTENLDALVSPPPSPAAPLSGYIKSLPNDGWGNPFLYTNPTPSTYTLSSSGPDGTPNTPDDLLPPP